MLSCPLCKNITPLCNKLFLLPFQTLLRLPLSLTGASLVIVSLSLFIIVRFVYARKMARTWKKAQTSQFSGNQPFSPNPSFGRNLRKSELGGVIFGCKNATMKECLSKQLFGLPAQHFSYVKNIDPGLPLFLFNYTNRRLHGIFEAASKGRMFLDPYGWTNDGSERTQYPAQVKICVRLQCQPLSEDKFKELLADNYYIHNHFWFELDHAQTSKLISVLSSGSIVSGNSVLQNTQNWMPLSRPLTSNDTWGEDETCKMLELETDYSAHSSTRTYWSENDNSLAEHIQPLDTNEVENEVNEDETNSVFLKLKELTVNSESQEFSLANNVNDSPDMNSIEKGYTEVSDGLDKKEESSDPPFEYQYNIAQLLEEVKELTSFKKIQTERNSYLEQKLIEAEMEIQHLKDRCTLLEYQGN